MPESNQKHRSRWLGRRPCVPVLFVAMLCSIWAFVHAEAGELPRNEPHRLAALLAEAQSLKKLTIDQAGLPGAKSSWSHDSIAQIRALKDAIDASRSGDERVEMQRADALMDLAEVTGRIASSDPAWRRERVALAMAAAEILRPIATRENVSKDNDIRTRWTRVNSLLGMAWAARYQEDDGKTALEYYDLALEAAETYSEGTPQSQFESFTWIPTVLAQKALLLQTIGGWDEAHDAISDAIERANRQSGSARTPQAFEQLGFIYANAAEIYRRQSKHAKELLAAETGIARFIRVKELGGSETPYFLSVKAALYMAVGTATRNKNKAQLSREEKRSNLARALKEYTAAREIWTTLHAASPAHRFYGERVGFLNAAVAEVELLLGGPEMLARSSDSYANALRQFAALHRAEPAFGQGLEGPRLSIRGTSYLFGLIAPNQTLRLMALRNQMSAYIAPGRSKAISQFVIEYSMCLRLIDPILAQATAEYVATSLIHLRLVGGPWLSADAQLTLEQMIADRRSLGRERRRRAVVAAHPPEGDAQNGGRTRVLDWCRRSGKPTGCDAIPDRLPGLD